MDKSSSRVGPTSPNVMYPKVLLRLLLEREIYFRKKRSKGRLKLKVFMFYHIKLSYMRTMRFNLNIF
jgi:hypothetical protein